MDIVSLPHIVKDRLIGGVGQLVNEMTGRVPLPFGPFPRARPGDVFEARGPVQRAGANGVDRALSLARPGPQAARLARPLLAASRVLVPGGVADALIGASRVSFGASAAGADWSDAARSCGMVAVYVDGTYHSTVVVQGERTVGYSVALGALSPGEHEVELRAALDAAPVAPTVRNVQTSQVTGPEARIDQLAPVLELRGPRAGRLGSATRTDAPLLMVPAVTRHEDGSSTIEYRVTFSNEDGGTETVGLYAAYGRGVDTEPVLRVDLAADGTVEGEWYQSPLHQWRPFDGDRVGGRPLIRVSTANNMVSSRVHEDGGERWSDTPMPAIDGRRSEFESMRANPWTWQVMAKELLREGKAVPGRTHDGRKIGDPRSYVYLGDLEQAELDSLVAHGGADVTLTDGRRVHARTLPGATQAEFNETALELPLGVLGAQVAALHASGADGVVLGDDLLPRWVDSKG